MKRPFLHVVDTHTGYQNDEYITDKMGTALWRLFVETWATGYCGFPDVLRVDLERSFRTARFRESAANCSVVIQASGNDGHKSIGLGEMYPSPYADS